MIRCTMAMIHEAKVIFIQLRFVRWLDIDTWIYWIEWRRKQSQKLIILQSFVLFTLWMVECPRKEFLDWHTAVILSAHSRQFGKSFSEKLKISKIWILITHMSYFDSLKLTSKLKSSLKCIPAAAPLVTGEGRLMLAEDSLITLKQINKC